MSPSIKPSGFDGIPFIDTHVHVFPDGLFDAIWKYFESNYWNIHYRFYSEQIASFLHDGGVTGFTTLCYAHKPNLSKSMNQFIANFVKSHPEAIPLGTAHPGDKNLLDGVESALTSLGLKGFKFQLLVTDFYITDDRLIPVYDMVKKHDGILVFHAGTGPLANNYVGVKHFRKFIEKYPDMRVQVAHLGCFEYAEFFALMKEFPNMYLDNAMILVDHNLFPSRFNLDNKILLDFEDRIMFGSDFPNIPYDYTESWKTILNMGFPKSFFEKLFYLNARKFYHL